MDPALKSRAVLGLDPRLKDIGHAFETVERRRPGGIENLLITGHRLLPQLAFRGLAKFTKYRGDSPRNTDATSRHTLATTRFCPSIVNAAICGVKITFSNSDSGDAPGGSVARTSS